jgi:hypothetical protein
MLTIALHRSAVAVLFALAFTASSGSAAKADWAISSSCVGGWGAGACFVQKRSFPRDPHVRQVGGFDNEADAKASAERDRKWTAFCKPVAFIDRYGVERLSYAHPGCEHGRSQ